MSSHHPPTIVLFQDKCLAHRYIRSTDTSLIFERPQRLRAVKIGVSAVISRLQQCIEGNEKKTINKNEETDESLTVALERLQISNSKSTAYTSMMDFSFIRTYLSDATVDILNHPAVDYIHGGRGGAGDDGDDDDDVYLRNLINWVKKSERKVSQGESEIPENLSQGDLYLCGGSLDAIQGAIGTVCEAVDMVAPRNEGRTAAGPSRAFVAIRPPGHHCGEDTPSGFCFVNNIAVAAAHAHLKHNISRIVILDIDLHHGNGTQSIIWQINEEYYRKQTETEEEGETKPVTESEKKGLQIYYGSIHDVLSYPCEDGNINMVQAASVSIHGPHGQHVENVHMSSYTSEEDFWNRLYTGQYSRLLSKAEEFLKKDPDSEALIFISAGFDGSEHETPSMQRHGCKLPTGFFRRFTKETRILADKYTKGRMISVLEGGYSDRALISGVMAHIVGLVEEDGYDIDENWWSTENLSKLEKATKKRRGGRSSVPTTPEIWIEETLSVLSSIDIHSPPPTPKIIPPSTMTLRDRSKNSNSNSSIVAGERQLSSKPPSRSGGSKSAAGKQVTKDEEDGANNNNNNGQIEESIVKKLPKVFLRVNPPSEQ